MAPGATPAVSLVGYGTALQLVPPSRWAFDLGKVKYRLQLRRAQEMTSTRVPRAVSLCLVQDFLLHHGYARTLDCLQRDLAMEAAPTAVDELGTGSDKL